MSCYSYTEDFNHRVGKLDMSEPHMDDEAIPSHTTGMPQLRNNGKMPKWHLVGVILKNPHGPNSSIGDVLQQCQSGHSPTIMTKFTQLFIAMSHCTPY